MKELKDVLYIQGQRFRLDKGVFGHYYYVEDWRFRPKIKKMWETMFGDNDMVDILACEGIFRGNVRTVHVVFPEFRRKKRPFEVYELNLKTFSCDRKQGKKG